MLYMFICVIFDFYVDEIKFTTYGILMFIHFFFFDNLIFIGY
jgi:hypothetical protein